MRPQVGFEGVTGTLRHVIDLPTGPFVCELFLHSDDPHDQQRFVRRQRVQLLGRHTNVAPAEDMIVTKLRWAGQAHRWKDRDDVRNMIAVRGSELDWPYVRRWTDEHGTTAILDEVIQSLPRE